MQNTITFDFLLNSYTVESFATNLQYVHDIAKKLFL